MLTLSEIKQDIRELSWGDGMILGGGVPEGPIAVTAGSCACRLSAGSQARPLAHFGICSYQLEKSALQRLQGEGGEQDWEKGLGRESRKRGAEGKEKREKPPSWSQNSSQHSWECFTGHVKHI